MMNKNVKKSLEKSKKVLEEKRKIVQQKICIKKTHTFTIIAMNSVQEKLIIKKLEKFNVSGLTFANSELSNDSVADHQVHFVPEVLKETQGSLAIVPLQRVQVRNKFIYQVVPVGTRVVRLSKYNHLIRVEKLFQNYVRNALKCADFSKNFNAITLYNIVLKCTENR